ncbi:putative disease resistance protein RGA3 [Mangifera indica]|uniref:putative disease resistance protein RGA3 n=1 Tax=Mangifera indica TaxID=29780 RepID=UPI001CFC456E|nr:putative disease resistance protein RGA3 [Mangifera indica]
MAEAIVSLVLKQLGSVLSEQASGCIGKQVSLVWDVDEEVEKLTHNLEAIQAVLFDAEQKQIKNAAVRLWLHRLKDVCYDVDDVLDEWNTAILKLRIEGVMIIMLLLRRRRDGGIGKTTLAQFAYNNNEVENKFDKKIWVCVSEPFDEIRIAKAIIQSLKNNTPNVAELEYLLQCIRDSVKTKKFLLILDDVWTENNKKWEPFYNCLKNGLHGSKILITTRKESVARIMKSNDIINVGELSNEENWLLFEKLALSERLPEEYKNLEEIGRKIVRKCKGLPLAVKTIGSLLQFKKSKEQWQHVLDSEMWKFEDTEKGLLTPLMLSYNDLTLMVKRCFVCCSIYPKDYNIDKRTIVDLWMAQGYLRKEKNDENENITGEEYLDYLVTRSLLQKHKSFSDSYMMHDIVHDFAQFLGDKECSSIEVYGDEDSLKNSPRDKRGLPHNITSGDWKISKFEAFGI